MGDETVDMTGFYSSPWGPTESSLGSGLSDTPTNDYAPAPSVAYDSASSFMTGNTVSGASSPSATFLGTTKSAFDFGLKAADQLIASYGKVLGLQGQVQDAQLNRYIKSSSIDLAKIQLGGQLDVAKLKAETNSNVARIYANSAGSAAGLANMGQTPSSLMLYLTIAGVLFTFIQVMNSRS
jgi:hypothetical protein